MTSPASTQGTFYNFLQQRYGRQAADTMKSMAKYNRKLGAASVKKLFLIKCRKNKVFPKYLNNFLRTNSLVHTTNPRYRFKLDKIISSTKQKMLNLDIKTSFSDISYYKKIIVTLETQARECIPLEYINEFKMRQKKFYMNYVKTEGARLDNKLSRLLAEQKIQGWDYSNSTKDRRDWIVNLTDKVISDDILNVVCLGPVFSLPSRGNNSDIITLLADVESYLDTVKESDVRSWIRVSISNIVTNFINKKWVKGVQETEEMRMIRKGMAECKKFLNENKEIILLNSDKGNKSVIMERAEYRDKMSDLLKDNATYRILKGDPTMKIQRKSNGHIKDLVDLGIITKERGIFLKTHNGLAPKIYGLPKIHKEGVPLRPIVSCLGSPTYHLAKYMARIINCLRSNNMYSVKDSYTFKDRVVEQQVPPGYILISLDVKSLFTSIPTDWITEELRKNWKHIRTCTEMPMGKFLEIMEFLFKSGYFVYDGVFYEQIAGLPMGDPLSPDGADIVMGSLLNAVMPTFAFYIPFLYIYVDDIFTAVPSDMVTHVLETFNAYRPEIQFTVELEVNGRLPFLDTVVTREVDGMLSTEWYSKPMASNRMVNYKSSHSMSQKVNVCTGLMRRIFKLSSGGVTKSNKGLVMDILQRNGYPRKFINRLINNRPLWDREKVSNTMIHDGFCSVPFIEGLTSKLRKVIKREYPNTRITSRSLHSLRRLYTNMKDPVSKMNRSGLVYKVKCKGCEGVYYGETMQYLNKRMQQHRNDVSRGSKTTALAEHAIGKGHVMDLENVEVVCTERNTRKRKFLEAVHIVKDRNSINFQKDSEMVSESYFGIIHGPGNGG